ncbi:hypothetical protein GCM10010531_36310 [Blastococcus jejuensis]|uniref:Uncharacterized protein n=1 Tax=Blastococcus jejuensis TaxID=351224 RepID=A0ABP6PHQ1_9ACTN
MQRLEALAVPFAPRRRPAWRTGLGLGVRLARVVTIDPAAPGVCAGGRREDPSAAVWRGTVNYTAAPARRETGRSGSIALRRGPRAT